MRTDGRQSMKFTAHAVATDPNLLVGRQPELIHQLDEKARWFFGTDDDRLSRGVVKFHRDVGHKGGEGPRRVGEVEHLLHAEAVYHFDDKVRVGTGGVEGGRA